MKFSPDGKTLASGNTNGAIKCWDVATGNEQPPTAELGDAFNGVGFSHDGLVLAATTRGARVKLLDLAKAKERASLSGHTGGVWSTAFSPDDQTLATGSSDATAKLWDVSSGQLLTSLNHDGGVFTVAFAPNGKQVVTGHQPVRAVLGRGNRPAAQDVPLSQKEYFSCMTLTPDGKTLAVGIRNKKSMELWDAGTGKPRTTLPRFKNQITRVELTSDGRAWLRRSTMWKSSSGT